MKTRFDYPWMLHEARAEVFEDLERELIKVGFHCGLLGSVLHSGISSKDLDVIIYPRTTASCNLEDVYRVFRELGWRLVASQGVVQRAWKKQGSQDTKHIEVWQVDGKRIDVFFLK